MRLNFKQVRKENLKFFIVDAVIVMAVPFLTVQEFFFGGGSVAVSYLRGFLVHNACRCDADNFFAVRNIRRGVE